MWTTNHYILHMPTTKSVCIMTTHGVPHPPTTRTHPPHKHTPLPKHTQLLPNLTRSNLSDLLYCLMLLGQAPTTLSRERLGEAIMVNTSGAFRVPRALTACNALGWMPDNVDVNTYVVCMSWCMGCKVPPTMCGFVLLFSVGSLFCIPHAIHLFFTSHTWFSPWRPPISPDTHKHTHPQTGCSHASPPAVP